MRRYRGLFRPRDAFVRAQFSADYIITMFGFNLRSGQAANLRAKHLAEGNQALARQSLKTLGCSALVLLVPFPDHSQRIFDVLLGVRIGVGVNNLSLG
jgi:hypothetical protein